MLTLEKGREKGAFWLVVTEKILSFVVRVKSIHHHDDHSLGPGGLTRAAN